jgi:NADH-quinone oxidoreductase subunit L
MGGLARKLPGVALVFAAGALALAGLPPFSGFWSKDEILAAVLERGWTVHFALLVATAGLTAFYAGRLLLYVFVLKPEHEHHEIHKPGIAMTAPLAVLAVLSVAGGLALKGGLLPAALGPRAHSGVAMAASTAACLAGLGLAAAAFLRGRDRIRAFVEGPGKGLHRLVSNRYYMDEVYDFLVIRPLRSASAVAWFVVDRLLIDGVLVHGTGYAVLAAGWVLRRAHTGSINAGIGAFIVGALALLAYLFFRFSA